ncbi:MAG TPA: hypothetical protein VFC63_07370 [Blastocatellia bacterium]|nr:hypothetical protein [Blastocatellia bacterium]
MKRVQTNYSVIGRIGGFILLLLVAATPIIPQKSLQGKYPSAVINGVVTNTGNETLTMKTAQGARQVVLTDETNILRDDVEFSIANIDKAVLPASSIKVGSKLEVIGQYKDGRYIAGIVTVISADQRFNGIVASNK